jgi:hypothetical protein
MGKGRNERCTPLTKQAVDTVKVWLPEIPPASSVSVLSMPPASYCLQHHPLFGAMPSISNSLAPLVVSTTWAYWRFLRNSPLCTQSWYPAASQFLSRTATVPNNRVLSHDALCQPSGIDKRKRLQRILAREETSACHNQTTTAHRRGGEREERLEPARCGGVRRRFVGD